MSKKLLSIFTLLCLAVTSAWAVTPLSGDTWDNATKTLTVNSNPVNNAYENQTDIVHVVFAANVTSIGEYAFQVCSGLTSITFAEGSQLTTIGRFAFYDCNNTNLTSITIPASVTSIGNSAFAACKGLTSITFASESQLTTIGESAFASCKGLTSINIPASVTSIGNWAFASCKGLTSITIPASVTSIAGSAFGGCNNLATITVDANNGTYDSRNNCNAIIEKSSNKLVVGCKGTTIPNTVTAIGEYAFEFCDGLTSINIPASVTSIAGSAFGGCNNLATITVDANNGTYDSRNNCNAIIEKSSNTLVVGCKGTTIPNTVTAIGEKAFTFCDGLTSITIPSSVTSIGDSAFEGCTGLTSIEIPASVTSIGQSAFSACFGLASITFASGSKLKTIGESAFYACNNTGLTSIEIPASVTTIGNWAFIYCSYLESITIPASVTSIGQSAFEGCTGLASVTVYSTSCTLGTDVFKECTNLANIYVFSDLEETFKNSTTGWSAYSGKITAMTNPHGKCGASGHESDVRWVLTGTSPNYTLTIMKVGSTGAMASYGGDNQPWKDYRSDIKSVVIGNGVTTIGDGAFMACSNLATVTFDGNSQSIIFNQYAFSGCGFTSVTIPSNVTRIEDFTFSGCPNLTVVNIGKGVTSIINHAFNSCPKLTTITVDTENTKYDSRDNCNAIIETTSNTLVLGCKDTTIPNTVTSIGDAAFWKCAGLTSIAIPASVTSIGASAFKECPDLTSVTFATGSQLTSIGDLAFYDCKSLASIEIPASVTNIDGNAFWGCTNVTDVYCYADPDTWIDENCDDFIKTPAKTTVCHVAGSKLTTFETKWSTGSTDVNVTFMGDGFEPGGKAYLVKAITYKSGTMPDGVKAFLPVNYDLSTGTVTLAEVKGAPKGLPVIYGNATEDEALPDFFFLKYVADDSDDDKDIQSDYADKAKAMNKRFVITDGEKTLAEILAGISDVPANEALFLVLANGKFNTVNVSAADLEKKAKPGQLLFVLSKWEYMHLGSSTNTNPVGPLGTRSIGIGSDDGTATGIEAVENVQYSIFNFQSDSWYDLQGRRLSGKPARKGLYLQNGKKVVVK